MTRVHDACRVRLLSLASQRFIATALHDAMQVQARRTKQPAAQLKGAGHDIKDKRPTLTVEDLAQALQEVDHLMRKPSHLYRVPINSRNHV